MLSPARGKRPNFTSNLRDLLHLHGLYLFILVLILRELAASNMLLKNSLGYVILSEAKDLLYSFFSKIQQMLLPLCGISMMVRFFNNLLSQYRIARI